MRRPNHASRFEGIAKTNLQASRASDTETLQSQVNKAAEKRLSLSGLEILHGRLKKMHPRLLYMDLILQGRPKAGEKFTRSPRRQGQAATAESRGRAPSPS